MYHGQFFGKIVLVLVHIIWTMSMRYGQSRKKLFCPWTVVAHGQLSMKRTRPAFLIIFIIYLTLYLMVIITVLKRGVR
jgi:hypothetical protein